MTINTLRGDSMLGMLINHKEMKELEYLLKREMEELLHDLEEPRIDAIVKRAMEERYKIIFGLFKRLASPQECRKYLRTSTYIKHTSYTD
jgi:hypothetical protein